MKTGRPPEKDNGGFTLKQRVFIAEYGKDFNATQAAIRAGYSPKTANRIASRLLTNIDIRAAIDADAETRLWKAGVRAERVLAELARIGLHDLRKLYEKDGTLKPPHEWDDETAAAVAGVEVFEEFEGRGDDRKKIGETKKVKVFDKKGALELLGKHLKLFTDKVEHSGKDGGPIPIQMTSFPPMPATLDEWQKQVEEAEKARLSRQEEEDKSK